MRKNKLTQIIFWICIFLVNLVFSHDYHLGLAYELISTCVFAFIFYFNIIYLYPAFYIKNKRKYFITGSLTLLAAIIFLGLLLDHREHGRNFIEGRDHLSEKMIMLKNAGWIILMFMVSTIYSIQKNLNQQIERHKQIMEEKLQTELQLLKAQINPHFLFNALNNIYSLVYMKSSKAADSVLMLSEMLRYVIDDCCNEKVPLKMEISYIKSLTDFYKLKNPEDREISFNSNISNPDVPIAPMILIPFIENSFKYSRIEEDTKGFIHMDLTENSGELLFKIRNSKFQKRNILSGSGKGIENVRQRLGIIYPGNYTLSINEDEKTFLVELKIQLV